MLARLVLQQVHPNGTAPLFASIHSHQNLFQRSKWIDETSSVRRFNFSADVLVVWSGNRVTLAGKVEALRTTKRIAVNFRRAFAIAAGSTSVSQVSCLCGEAQQTSSNKQICFRCFTVDLNCSEQSSLEFGEFGGPSAVFSRGVLSAANVAQTALRANNCFPLRANTLRSPFPCLPLFPVVLFCHHRCAAAVPVITTGRRCGNTAASKFSNSPSSCVFRARMATASEEDPGENSRLGTTK